MMHQRSDADGAATDPTRAAAPGTSSPEDDVPSGRGDRDLSYGGELLRKGLHLLALVIPAGIYLLGRPAALLVLVPLSAAAVAADVARARSKRFSQLIRTVFGRMMRPSELPPDGRIVVNGATWVLVAATVLVLVFPVELAVPAFVSFMVADAAAALVGVRFGRHRWTGTRRTAEGTLAFAAVAFACLLPFHHVAALPALVAALTGAAAEIPEWPVNDNVRVPVVIAGVLLVFGL